MISRINTTFEREERMKITFYQANPLVREGYDEIYSMSYDRIRVRGIMRFFRRKDTLGLILSELAWIISLESEMSSPLHS